MLTLERFKALLDSYGAKPQRWPEAVRAEAEALLRVSAAARLLVAEAQEVDKAIEAASASEDAPLRSAREQEAALLRLRARVAARIELPASPTAYPSLRWVAVAAGSLAIAAGLALGSLYESAPPPDNMLALLQPAPLSIFSDQ